MRIVRFEQHWRQYWPGEVAGFDDTIARELVQTGVAKDKGEPKPEQPSSDSASGRYMNLDASDDGSGSLVR